jgi:MoxR-like ATPase
MNEPRYTGKATDFYRATPEVASVVNLAIDLRRPILVEGEPGCGKTTLATSIAREKNLGDVIKISVKSTSRAQDLLYRVNALKRLQDAQSDRPQAQYVYPYLSLGLLGRPIHARERRVVLLDEIDKADIDFPNDLLNVLDTFTFEIDDLPEDEEELCRNDPRLGFGRTVTGSPDAPPIIVITSNREKRLPEPFLRRCLYVRVKFPETAGELQDILRKNMRLTVDEITDTVLNAAVVSFMRVREIALGNTQKPPTTSELIDWVRILHWDGVSADTLNANLERPPHWGTLFKTAADLDAYDALTQTKQRA